MNPLLEGLTAEIVQIQILKFSQNLIKSLFANFPPLLAAVFLANKNSYPMFKAFL